MELWKTWRCKFIAVLIFVNTYRTSFSDPNFCGFIFTMQTTLRNTTKLIHRKNFNVYGMCLMQSVHNSVYTSPWKNLKPVCFWGRELRQPEEKYLLTHCIHIMSLPQMSASVVVLYACKCGWNAMLYACNGYVCIVRMQVWGERYGWNAMYCTHAGVERKSLQLAWDFTTASLQCLTKR